MNTLANCERLLEHFNKIIDGTIPRPEGHKNWHDVINEAEKRAIEMRKHIETKKASIKSRMNSTDPIYAPYWKYRTMPGFATVKKDAKKST